MFATADWTDPQVGGMLNECIVKEERELAKTRDAATPVRHLWNPDHLAHRPTSWKERAPEPPGGASTRQRIHGASAASASAQRYCRSAMQHERDMSANLEALQRAGQLQSLSAEAYSAMHPTYGAHESHFSTVTSSELIGMGAVEATAKSPSVRGREDMMSSLYVTSRNGPERLQMRALHSERSTY